jgi:hypothetical protein
MSWYNGVLTPSDPRRPRSLKPKGGSWGKYPQGKYQRRIESPIQISIVQWVRVVAPHCVIFSIPNERVVESVTQLDALCSMGLYPGITDLCVLAPVKDHWEPHMLEVKTMSDKSVLSPNQEEFRLLCAKRGIHHAVVRSIEDAREAFRFWGIKTKESAVI